MCELKGNINIALLQPRQEEEGGWEVYIYLQVTGKSTGDVVTKHTRLIVIKKASLTHICI